MGVKIPFNSFAAGEISDSLSARYELQKFKSACKALQNFIVELHGDARRRPGTYFLEDLGGDAVLLPFSFSSDPSQNYVLVFSNLKIRIANQTGFLKSAGVPIEIVSPYTTSQLTGISWAQSGDVVYLAHKSHALRKLTRAAALSWNLTTVSVDPTIAAPTGGAGTFTAGPLAAGQVAAPATQTVRYKLASVDAKGQVSLGSSAISVTSARETPDWIQGDSITLTWSAATGAVEYQVFRESGGYYGLVGVSDGTSFRDVKYAAETTKTPLEANNPFSGNNHPGLVAFHEQRLVLAGAALKPQTFYASQVGNFEGFAKSKPLKDDDPYEYTIASGSIDAINWVSSFGELLLGTGGAEYKASGGNETITPSNVQIKQQSYWGSAQLPPLIIGNSILHVQRQGSKVRDLFYSLEKDGYAGNDLSVLTPHLFDGRSIRQWSYQQAPGSVVWAVRDDGVLLGLTYLKEHEIWAWHRHVTAGEFRSVCALSGALEDQTFFVVKRTVGGQSKYYLELMQTKWTEDLGIDLAFFVDCGLSYYGPPATTISGLGHLEGKAVAVLADGSPVEGMVVGGGTILLPYAAQTVHVGLPYSSQLAPMPQEMDMRDGTSLGRLRTYGKSRIRVLETVGGRYGADLDNLFDFAYVPEDWSEAVPPFSGDLEFTPDGPLGAQSTVWIVQDRPLPMTVIALVLEVDLEG